MAVPPDVEHDHALPDGTTVHIRPIGPGDRERLLAMWERTSEASRRARFMGPFRLTGENVARFTDLDPRSELGLVATTGRGDGERIIGVARYVRYEDAPATAEFAALVEDAHQGRGIGTALVRHVARAAAEAGVTRLAGDILADNSRMLRLVRDLGLEVARSSGAGVVHADLELAFTERYLTVIAESERDAARAALQRFLRPERIAVVGASRDRRAIGGLVFDHLLSGDFQGVVYPVNPNARSVQGVSTYPSLSDCPEPPDLVLVCVPAPVVGRVVDEAGRLGVKAVCIISAGFAESGDEGQRRHDELMAVARAHGLRIIGPNCMGVLNAAADVRMNGTFSTTFPRPGRMGFSSQSGALGLAVLEHADELGLGVSTFVSVGNKADISGNDLLLYWEEDPDTDVILLYLESFGNPRKFSRIARRISRTKPIVAVKSGRTSAGVRAASSHTAAISAGDVAVDALFRQTGVIRTDTLEELFDVASLLSSQPLPSGNRVAILSNAGGPGILAADACESNGLSVPTLRDATRAQLAAFLPAEAGIANPVDMIASASAENYGAALRVLGNAEEIDAVFVIFIPAGTTDPSEFGAALAAAQADLPAEVPVVSVFMSNRGVPPSLTEARIPSFAFPEDAARAMGRVARYASWRARPLGSVIEPDDIDRERGRRIVEAALAAAGDEADPARRLVGRPHSAAVVDHGGRRRMEVPAGRTAWLRQDEADALLRAYGVPLARSRFVTSADAAGKAQREIGAPVALKVAAPIHKTDVGGVVLGLDSPRATAAAARDLEASLARAGMAEFVGSYVVQEMVGDGVEMVVGVTHDPSFGPIVMTGMGGTLVELIRDVSVRITPLTDADIDDMLASLRMRPLLEGYRGSPPADVDGLRDLLARINALVEDLPEITELDLNPVFVRERGQGVVAVDVRLKVTAV